MTVNNFFEKFLSALSLLRKTHNLSLTSRSVICRKPDCKSLKLLAISKGEIKMTVINKVPAKPTIEAVLRLATSEVIYKAFR